MINIWKTSTLRKILSYRQLNLLNSYYKNYTLREMTQRYGIKKSELFLEFIYLGKALAIFDWLYCQIIPPDNANQDFISGFIYCRDKLKQRIADVIRKEKRQKKLSRKKRFKR